MDVDNSLFSISAGAGGGGVIRNMNFLLADILFIFILYISFYKGVPPCTLRPPTRAADQCHERILSPNKNFFRPF